MIARTTCAGRPAWVLRTRRAAMVLSLSQRGEGGALLLDHWGADGGSDLGDDYLSQLPRNRSSQQGFLDGVPQVFPIYGDPSFKEPCLGVVFEDGTRIVRLALKADDISEPDGRPTLTLTFE